MPQRRDARRRGFTLVEVLVSTALGGLLLTQVVVTMVVSQRIYAETIADIEMSLQTRVLREKLLYHLDTEGGGLVNACQTGMEVKRRNPGKKTGHGLGMRLKTGPDTAKAKNIGVGQNKKLRIEDEWDGSSWLDSGVVVIRNEDSLFAADSNGVITVNMDLAIETSRRTYVQVQRATAQIMNE
jgi:prepilin-type N-terminal cleavage/methylation domain-containing protein